MYPVIYDSRNIVLSMPPIINGDHSKINLNTKNVFIECTGTDLPRTKVVLDTLVTMFSEHCEKKFEIEPVDVVDPDGMTHTYPTLRTRKEFVERQKANKCCGIDVSSDTMVKLLNRMCLPAEVIDGKIQSINPF